MTTDELAPWINLCAAAGLILVFMWMAVYMTVNRAKPALLWCVGTFALICLGILPASAWLRSAPISEKSVNGTSRPNHAQGVKPAQHDERQNFSKRDAEVL